MADGVRKGELWWTSRGDLHTDVDDEAWLYDHHAKRSAVPLPQLQRTDRAGALEAFVTAVSAGVQPESSGRENLGSLALAHAAVDSSLKREPVAVPSITSEKPEGLMPEARPDTLDCQHDKES